MRGAHFHLAVGPTIAALAAGGLLAAGTYALAEYLAYSLKQPQTFGTLIPAIGATPYLLCGALYPIATLPDGVRQLSWILPWSHAVALLRDGFIGSSSSHLDQIWHMRSQTAMVLLSLAGARRLRRADDRRRDARVPPRHPRVTRLAIDRSGERGRPSVQGRYPTSQRTVDMSGETDELKGRAKEAAGDLTGDKSLKNEGKTDRAAGKAKDAVDEGADKVKGLLRKD